MAQFFLLSDLKTQILAIWGLLILINIVVYSYSRTLMYADWSIQPRTRKVSDYSSLLTCIVNAVPVGSPERWCGLYLLVELWSYKNRSWTLDIWLDNVDSSCDHNLRRLLSADHKHCEQCRVLKWKTQCAEVWNISKRSQHISLPYSRRTFPLIHNGMPRKLQNNILSSYCQSFMH